MLRKGRFDELFFVDLPDESERSAVWKIVVERRGRCSGDFDLQQLSRITEGLTGAEIEAVFVESMFSAFERSKEPTDLDMAGAFGWVWMVFNSLIDLRQRVRQGWAQVDVQLKRLFDLIPNLVETVKGLRDYEKNLQSGTGAADRRPCRRADQPGLRRASPRVATDMSQRLRLDRERRCKKAKFSSTK